MKLLAGLAAVAFACLGVGDACAIEGSSAAGPIGGTDLRVAFIPPPGLYGGIVYVGSRIYDFADGNGTIIPALSEARATSHVGGAFLVWVPDVKLFGGSLAFIGTGAVANKCGHLFAGTGTICRTGFTDPYIEAAWGRQFGQYRPSKYPGAFPIFEGLAITFGFGMVLPLGQYDAFEAQNFAASNGNHVWDFSPSVAVSFTTPPMLAEGTEFSAKLYWNNYLVNPATQYLTGQLINVDFAVTEHIGRWQLGFAGFYVTQIEGDKLFGATVSPDGRRTELLYVGGVVAYDMPEIAATLKLKVLTTAVTHNTGSAQGVIVGLAKKLY